MIAQGLTELRWDGVPTLAQALDQLKAQLERTPPPRVRVIGWRNEFQFAEGRMPTLDEINKAAPDSCWPCASSRRSC